MEGYSEVTLRVYESGRETITTTTTLTRQGPPIETRNVNMYSEFCTRLKPRHPEHMPPPMPTAQRQTQYHQQAQMQTSYPMPQRQATPAHHQVQSNAMLRERLARLPMEMTNHGVLKPPAPPAAIWQDMPIFPMNATERDKDIIMAHHYRELRLMEEAQKLRCAKFSDEWKNLLNKQVFPEASNEQAEDLTKSSSSQAEDEEGARKRMKTTPLRFRSENEIEVDEESR